MSEMAAMNPGVLGREDTFHLYHAKLYHPADCPLSLDSSLGAETSVTLVRLTDPAQGSLSCFTGWSQEPPSDLPNLQLNKEATDAAAVRHLREQAEINFAFFGRMVELSQSIRSSMKQP